MNFFFNQRGRLLEWALLARVDERIYTVGTRRNWAAYLASSADQRMTALSRLNLKAPCLSLSSDENAKWQIPRLNT
jgi:hypothetical protein